MINSPTGRSIYIYCSPVGDIDIIELMKKYIKILGKVRPTVDGDWSKDKVYDILTIVYDKDSKKSYISRKKVPVGINILNKDYWMNISTTRVDNDSIVLLSNPNDIGQINSFTLQEAVDSFDNEDKRIGLFISFYEKPIHELDTYKWNLYQFIGSDINQFNDITKWISIYNRSNKFLGLYLTEGKLNEVKRSPEVGDYAFVGNTLKEAIIYRCNVNGKWTKTKESAVDYIELKLSGNVTVGENGNWFNNGVDTGFKAKGEDGKTPQIVVSKDNKLQVSYDGINFTNITENIVYTQYRVSGNKLQYSIDLGKTWNDASGFISANFRWKPTSVAAGKIQISRENEVWEDLSPEFVSNSADEEDLESVIIGDNNRVIREKSVKEYNPAEFSGLGRVILRKNIVQGKNVLTQEMINKPNTVYEIRYDFDLNDTTINVPENCTLDFQGGSFSNGVLNGNNTNIKSNINFIFNKITFEGIWGVAKIYPEWFGAKGDEITNDTIAIQNSINFASICKSVVLLTRNYFIPKGGINLLSNVSIISNNNSKIITNCEGDYYSYIFGNYELGTNLENVLISGLCFEQRDVIIKSYDIGETRLRPIFIVKSSNIIIKNCDFYLKGANAIFIGGDNKNITIINNKIFNGDKNNIIVDQSAIYIEAINVNILNNTCADYINDKPLCGGIEIHGSNFIVSNNIIENVDSAFNVTPFRGRKNTDKQNIISNNNVNNVINFISLWGQGNEEIILGNLFIDSNIVKCNRILWNVTSDILKSIINNIIVSNNVFTHTEIYNKIITSNDFINSYAIMFWCYNKIENIIIKNNTFNNYPTGIVLIDGKDARANMIIEYNRFNNFMSIPFNNIIEYTKNNWVSIIYNNNNSKIIFNNNYVSVNKNIDFYFTFGAGIIDEFNNNINNTNNIIGIKEFINSKEHKILIPNIDRHGYKNDIIKYNNQLLSEIIENGTIDNKKIIGNLCKLHNHVFINNTKNLYLADTIYFSTNLYNCKRALIVAIINNKYYIDSEDDLFNTDNINENYNEPLNEGNFVFPKTKLIKTCNIIIDKNDIGNIVDGNIYLNIDNNKLYLYHKKWIDAFGNPVEAKQIGTTAQRPTGVQIGFTYKDTDLNKWIIWNGEAWENIDGTALI